MKPSALSALVAASLALTACKDNGSEPADKRPQPQQRAKVVQDGQIEGLPTHAKKMPGFFHKAPEWIDGPETEPTGDQVAAADTPYHQGVLPAPTRSGVTIYDPDAAYDGVNLVVSAHRPEASLRDMKGNVLHTWSYEFLDVWPEPLQFFEHSPHKTSWRRVHLFPNGDLLAIFEGIGMIKLDAHSNLLWKNKGRCHHDIHVADDGTIYTLSRASSNHKLLSAPILEDFVMTISPEGETLKEVSLLNALVRSEFKEFVRQVQNMSDIFHSNTVELLDGRLADKIPAFKAGSVLVSMRNIHLIAVVDLELEKVTWATQGKWKWQHQPSVLDNGNILIFDNLGVKVSRKNPPKKGASRVYEFDPVTMEIGWLYRGTDEHPFDSRYLGSCQRLPNGNTLVTDSVCGRAFEVTPEKEIVWEWINPHRAGEDNELIATLCEMLRFDWSALDFPALNEAREKLKAAVEIEGVEKQLENVGK